MKSSKKSKKKKIDIKPSAGGATSIMSKILPELPICIIILGAFLIRLCHLYAIIHNDPNYLNFAGTDMAAYDSTAMQIINGTLPKEPYNWYPAYCYFIATVYFILGHNPVTVMVIQGLIGSITCWLVYLIGKELFNKSVGIIAALLCSLYGTIIMYSAVLLSPVLDKLLIVLAVFIGIKSIERKNEVAPLAKVYFLVLGVVLGLSCLSRPNMLLVAPFFLIYILIMVKGIKKALLASLLVIAGIVMMLAPVTIRNYMYSGGKFIPIVSGGSMEVWVGNNEDSDGIYYVSPLAKYIEQHFKDIGNKDPYLADTLEFITKKPAQFCLLLLKKLALFWNSEGIHDNNIMYERIRAKSPILWLSLSYGLIAPLALTGMVLLLLSGYSPAVRKPELVRGKKPQQVEASIYTPQKALLNEASLLYLVIFGFMTSIVLFFVQSRVRQPIIPCLIIFASFTIYWFYKNIWLQKQRTSPLLLFVIIFGIFYGLVNTQLYMRWLYPIIKPHGFCIEKRYGTIIRDDTGIWHGNKAVDLNSTNKILKKELFIDFEPSAKEKGIGINMFYSCEVQGSLSVEINGKKIPDISLNQLATHGFYRVVRLGIKPEFFKKGINTIIFRVTEGAFLQIPIDNYYKYKRSMFSKDNGKSWKVKAGEYRIHLDMDRGSQEVKGGNVL